MAYVKARRVRHRGVPPPVVQPPSEPAKDVFLRVYERTLNEREARRASNISAKELARLRVEDPAFDDRCDEFEQQFIDKIEDLGFRRCDDDAAMIRFFLERRRPEKYSAKSQLNINVRDVTKLSDEELEAYIAQCQGKQLPKP